MSKSVKAKVDNLLARVSHLLREENVLLIHAAMAALEFRAEKVSTTKRGKFQL
jgi:hypothetical protein